MRRNERIKEVKDHMLRTQRGHLLCDHGALWNAIEGEIVALQERVEKLEEMCQMSKPTPEDYKRAEVRAEKNLREESEKWRLGETFATQTEDLKTQAAKKGKVVMSEQREMPKYQSSKRVRALKIRKMFLEATDGSMQITPEDGRYASFVTRPGFADRISRTNCPEDDMGYYVVYEDGFTSWSPTDVFERNHKLIRRAEPGESW